jgi:catechol 2,3-dioxygenase-like lactoylglutathione lyase family enzyme
MFKDTRAFSGFSVDDLEAARAFYAETLGMEVSLEHGLMHLHVAGGSPIVVYPKVGHVPATFTILNFPVARIEAAVDALAERGVRFLRYDGIETDERGILRGNGPNIAWFNDPAGNILSVVEQGAEAPE